MSTLADGRPLLSIAMPTYEHGHALPAALDSILASPGSDQIEIVVSNNASTDDTAEILDRYASRHPNIRAFHVPETVTFDENLARAMERCTGRYIWTMSSDDALAEGALPYVLNILAAQTSEAILVANWWIADEDLKPRRLRRGRHADQVLADRRRAIPLVGVWTLFMSCLILPGDQARAAVDRYRGGDGLTHWKIATQLATSGTAVIDGGEPIVLQRIVDPVHPPAYDVPVAISQNVRRHIGSLRGENLSDHDARRMQSLFLRIVVRAYVGTALQRWPGVGRRWFRPLLRDYWMLPAFWIWVAPLYALPQPLLRTLWRTYVRVRDRVGELRRKRL